MRLDRHIEERISELEDKHKNNIYRMKHEKRKRLKNMQRKQCKRHRGTIEKFKTYILIESPQASKKKKKPRER